ncbi:NADH-quinone oxidoreductase subunit C [Streptomyces luteoverticillatus]|uniref:NADH-quinone oxidoreductase subunit C n=1 Tax=Streptomyces luteoverticillatus TaxID=66425 RepID=A0A3Q9FX22_STRLT|nr:NADH-quinone oxidoreductase subunit C [Streptomyces luteoverticillatus]AZQ72214.1 NADH-quinone oxidoreductase subunit C [Streptomyces luteoverticillatus]
MTEPVAWLPGAVTDLFGADATAEEAYDLLTVDVPAGEWLTALRTARDQLGCTFFDWLSAVDEPGTGFRVCAHVAALPQGAGGTTRRLLLRTTVPHEAPALPSAVGVYAGAAWHERETHEMFGIDFPGHPHLVPLLLPEGFEGHPLRKDFVLAARVVKAWPGAKEPGEAAEGGPKRRQMLPPGVPDPNEWGPLKGQLPPAPARPARTPRAAAAGAGAGAERPVRRARSVAEGSASQAGAEAAPRRTRSVADGSASQAAEGAAPAPRRARSAAEGSASQAGGAEAAPRRTRSAADGSASQAGAEAAPRRTRSAADGSASQQQDAAGEPTRPRPAPRSSDAPWHHARPAFDEAPTDTTAPESPAEPAAGEPRRDGAQPEDRSPAVPNAPAPEAEAPARTGKPAPGAPGTDEPAAGEPGTGKPAPGEPAAGEPRTDEAARPAEPAAGEPRTGEPVTRKPAAGESRGPENDQNPAGGDPA